MRTFPRCLVAILSCGFAAMTCFAADDLPLGLQREQQKKVLAEVERTARQVSTTLRVLTYQKVDPGTEQKVLEEVAGTLRGLSNEQIKGVIAHLEAAAKSPDDEKATAESRAAYVKHRQIVGTLKQLVIKLETLRSLDHAADRFDKLAKEQHALALKAGRAEMLPPRPTRYSRSIPTDDREEQADSQTDLRTELTGLMKQLAVLKDVLTPDLKERMQSADPVAKSGGIVAEMTVAGEALKSGAFKDAAFHQTNSARELQTIAAALRSGRNKLTQLKEAKEKVEKLMAVQDNLTKDTQTRPQPMEQPQRFSRVASGYDPDTVHAAQLAERQAQLQYDTRDVRKAIEGIAKDAAEKIAPAEREMSAAESSLRRVDPEKAVEPQENAQARLNEAKKKLDELIAAAEKDRADPLTAIQNAQKLLEKLIEDQKQTQDQTRDKKDEPNELTPTARKQSQVARRAENLKDMPLPETKGFKEAMQKATDEARNATQELNNKKPEAALPKQDDALKAMEQAKKALEAKADELKKRQQEQAKLNDAIEKLAELARQEASLARQAAQKSNESKPQTDELAKKQEKITPPTKEVGKDVQEMSKDASNLIREAAEKMDAAQASLQRQQPKPASGQAQEAANKLNQAKDQLQKKMDELKGKDAADQAAMQPQQVNPADAAQQLAKAIEQAQMAADKANQAAEKLQQQKSQQQNLAQLQKQLADKAQQQGEKSAAADAADAAKSLQQGDLSNAVQQQQQALDKLNQSAQSQKGQPMKGDGQQAGQMAQQQKDLMDATKAMQQSAQANQAAQAALGQAQAMAPQSVQQQLNQAGQKLNQAGQQLGQGQPQQAGQNQQQAADQLGQALQTLNAAAQQMGKQGQQPGQPQQAQANAQGQQPGQQGQPGQPGQQGQQGQPGQPGQPGQQPGQNGQPGQRGQNSQERNDGRAEGNRDGPGVNKNAQVQGNDVTGDGKFINLQKRERERVQQAAEAAFPAEFRELIKQYNINIKDKPKPALPTAGTPAPADKK